MTSRQLEYYSNFKKKKKINFRICEKINLCEVENKQFAIRTISISKRFFDEKEKLYFIGWRRSEYKKMMDAQLKNVLKIYGFFYDKYDEEIRISMEACDCNLRSFVEKGGNITSDDLFKILGGMLAGLKSIKRY